MSRDDVTHLFNSVCLVQITGPDDAAHHIRNRFHYTFFNGLAQFSASGWYFVVKRLRALMLVPDWRVE
jgi:hypothetical protein